MSRDELTREQYLRASADLAAIGRRMPRIERLNCRASDPGSAAALWVGTRYKPQGGKGATDNMRVESPQLGDLATCGRVAKVNTSANVGLNPAGMSSRTKGALRRPTAYGLSSTRLCGMLIKRRERSGAGRRLPFEQM
jgi:hypothetical protein